MSDRNNILLLNRDEKFLDTMGNSLRNSGYSVTTGTEMREALTALSSNSVGLILCDNRLKDVSGYDFIGFLKKDPLRENIPFIFCVPLQDQGRAIQAFKSGAADFIVYPIEPEEIIKRIGEIFPLTGNGGKKIPSQADQQIDLNATQMRKIEAIPGKERRDDSRSSLQQAIRVEISRNGILWIPAQVKNINSKGLFLKTSMLGKAGVELYVRISIPTGTSVIKGLIKHVTFQEDDPSAGAGIGIEMEKSIQWKEFLQFIASHLRKGNSAPAAPKPQEVNPPSPKNIEATILISRDEEKSEEEPSGRMDISQKSKVSSYEQRFYHSLIGKQLNNYKVVSLIGYGGMGGVFKGWDIALERTVALKVISFELSNKEKFREMFIKEARMISRLENQNIASIYHIGNENQILYFAMEYIEGVTLADLIRKEEKLNSLKGLEYLITVCEALDFVSKKNIIHRDLKPANIMISDQDVIKIVDFGVAKTIDLNEKNREGIVGSPYYVSPDVIQGRPLDQRSDIYSLGASFYHAFTGFPPFEGETAEDVLLKCLDEDLVPLKKKNPKVSNSLGRVIEKMMAKRPEERYQNYKEIIKELKSLQSKASKFEILRNATLIFRIKK